MVSGGLPACRPGFFLAVRVMSRLFRRRFLKELAVLHRRDQLRFFGEYAALADRTVFARWLAPLRACEWVVYEKRPFAGPEVVLACLSRYTHRVAISSQRFIALDERGVTFGWKDYRAKGHTLYKTMARGADELTWRFLLHGLPGGFHRIHHYGLLANPVQRHRLATIRVLLHLPQSLTPATTRLRLPRRRPSSANTAARQCHHRHPSAQPSDSRAADIPAAALERTRSRMFNPTVASSATSANKTRLRVPLRTDLAALWTLLQM